MTQPSSLLPDPQITVEKVRDLAVHAGLPLAREREAAVAAILNAWVPDANALSRKMSAAAYLSLGPITVFTHPGAAEAEARA